MRFSKVLGPLVFLSIVTAMRPSEAANSNLRVGLSKKDITFLAAGRGMMGYGDLAQKTQGIESALFARSVVLETNKTDRVAMVVVDLCFIVSFLKDSVLRKLEAAEPGHWRSANLMIMATHTHSGPGGIAQHDIYNVTSQGFDQSNFDTIAKGIAASVLDASSRLTPARMTYSMGELRGSSINRSREPYLANVDAGRYQDETDPTHTVLGFVSTSGKPLGLFDFFAVHTTSMSKKNRLISADSKGHAARRVEAYFGGDFVAAFGNSNEGDASPNIFKGTPEEKSLADLDKTLRVADKQYQHALKLWHESRPIDVFKIDARHRWVDMPVIGCEPAMGESFAAGADDGPSGIPGFFEGMRQGESRPLPQYGAPVVMALRAVVGSTSGDEVCQYPKPILFAGDAQHPRILPRTLPFQVIQLGPVLVSATPAEMTTMSGRRIREALLEVSKSVGVKHVVLAGLANDYSGYVTTPEEYAFQHYEGAHTLYGPKTLEIHLGTLVSLASQLGSGEVDSSRKPSFFRPLGSFLNSARADGKAPWERIGSYLTQPPKEVKKGKRIDIVVRSGLPNRFSNRSRPFELEVKKGSRWESVSLPERSLVEWRRDKFPLCFNCSRLELQLETARLSEGTYRVIQKGTWKPLIGRTTDYASVSRDFDILD